MDDIERKVREAAQAFKRAVLEARAAGYRVTWPAQPNDLDRVNVGSRGPAALPIRRPDPPAPEREATPWRPLPPAAKIAPPKPAPAPKRPLRLAELWATLPLIDEEPTGAAANAVGAAPSGDVRRNAGTGEGGEGK